ncbi:MAG: hypothetical protein Q4E55_08855 [Bacteroidales bacterium]|nr:hypothetical protein [Bacteroidales bacterium]
MIHVSHVWFRIEAATSNAEGKVLPSKQNVMAVAQSEGSALGYS